MQIYLKERFWKILSLLWKKQRSKYFR